MGSRDTSRSCPRGPSASSALRGSEPPGSPPGWALSPGPALRTPGDAPAAAAIKHSWPSAALLSRSPTASAYFIFSPLKTHEATFPFALSLIHFHLPSPISGAAAGGFRAASGWQEEAPAALEKANEDKAAAKGRGKAAGAAAGRAGQRVGAGERTSGPLAAGSRAGCGVGTPGSGAGAITAPSGAACGAEPPLRRPDRLRGRIRIRR